MTRTRRDDALWPKRTRIRDLRGYGLLRRRTVFAGYQTEVNTVAINAGGGFIFWGGLTTAAGASDTLAVTNSSAEMDASSRVFVSIFNDLNTAGTPILGTVKVTSSTTIEITVHNIHATDAFNGSIGIAFFIDR